ncbi:hypothetical protein BDV32DRAFT_156044 [Aspergillus pseudonomiae]|nr:hypothetical protein BDV32DRAFT_156044 [Aspergillus pseudonomiae]
MTWLNRVLHIPHVPRPFRRLIRFLRGQSDELTSLSDQMPSYEETSTTVVPYVDRGNITVETYTTVQTSPRGPDIGGTKDLTTDSASARSTLIENTGTDTQLCTPFSKYIGSNILEDTDDLFPSVGGPSITRAPSPSEDHSVEMQHFGETTPRDSEETIVLPNPDLTEMFIGTGMAYVPHTG